MFKRPKSFLVVGSLSVWVIVVKIREAFEEDLMLIAKESRLLAF